MRRLPRCRCQHGASRLELLVCIVLFGIFVAVFLDRASYYQEVAEKTAMEMTVENIRTGLRWRIADLMLTNRLSEIPSLADENPINWLGERPANYLGEFEGTPPVAMAGRWYFERRNRELVYTVNNRRHFESLGGEDPSLRFKARLITAPRDKGVPSGENWVALVPSRDYRWQP